MKTTLNPFARFAKHSGRNPQHLLAMFDNPGEAIAEIYARSNGAIEKDMKAEPSFYGNETKETVIRKSVSGDEALAKRAEAFMNKIEAVDFKTKEYQRVASPFGRAIIGAYLASDPLACRRTIPIETETAPLSIVVSLNSRWDVSAAKLEQRGLVIAALVRKLIMSRPVNLYLTRFCHNGDSNSAALIRFPTTPCDSYRLAWMLSSQGFARGLLFAFHTSADQYFAKHDKKVFSNTLAIGAAGNPQYVATRHCDFSADLAEYLRSETLYIPGSYPGLADYDRMTSKPIEWLNETVAYLTKTKA